MTHSADPSRDPARDRVALLIAAVLGAFLLLSLIGVFILALNDQAPENLWAALFSLATALLGGLTGWFVGTARPAPIALPPREDTPP